MTQWMNKRNKRTSWDCYVSESLSVDFGDETSVMFLEVWLNKYVLIGSSSQVALYVKQYTLNAFFMILD